MKFLAFCTITLIFTLNMNRRYRKVDDLIITADIVSVMIPVGLCTQGSRASIQADGTGYCVVSHVPVKDVEVSRLGDEKFPGGFVAMVVKCLVGLCGQIYGSFPWFLLT